MNTTGLTRCYRCGAVYQDGCWYLVRYEGTSITPKFDRKIPDGQCPICLDLPQTEPPRPMPGPM